MSQVQMWNSAEKGLQSPSTSMLHSPAEIRARLNFSSAMTPPALLRRGSFGDHDTPSNINNRLGDYHMSKQNPAVLDFLYSSPSSYKAASPLFNYNYTNGFPVASRNGRTPLSTSLLRQTLSNNTRRNSLSGPGSSLVHLAAQRKHRNYDSVPVSPVIVRLTGPASTVEDTTCTNDENRKVKVNPCDKNVVISALKKSRKRWATSSSEPLSDFLPSAKRARPNLQPEAPSYTPRERKRQNDPPPLTSQVIKRSKTLQLPPSTLMTEKPLNKIRVPEIEYESDLESESGTTGKTREEASGDGGARERSCTPPVEEKEEDVKKMREQTLKLQRSLTTVFPSSLKGKSSSRRKLPVLCATGSKPHIPTPLSTSHSATHEDLKKDRKLAAAKLKHFLSEVEDVKGKAEVNKATSLTLSASTSQQPVVPPSTTANALNLATGLQDAKPLANMAASISQTISTKQPPLGIAVCLATQGESSSTATTSTITVPVMSTGLTATQPAASLGLQSVLQPTPHQHPSAKSVSFAVTTSVNTTVSNVLTQAPGIQTDTQKSQSLPQVTAGGLLTINGGNGTLAASGTAAAAQMNLLPTLQLPSSQTGASSSMVAPASLSASSKMTASNPQMPSSNGLGGNQQKQSLQQFSFPGNSKLGNLFGGGGAGLFQQTQTTSAPSMSGGLFQQTQTTTAPSMSGGLFQQTQTTTAPSMSGGLFQQTQTTSAPSMSGGLFQQTQTTSAPSMSGGLFQQTQTTSAPSMSGGRFQQTQTTSAPSMSGGLFQQSQTTSAPSMSGGLFQQTRTTSAPSMSGGLFQQAQTTSAPSMSGGLFQQTQTTSAPSMSAPMLTLLLGQPSLFSSQPTSVAQLPAPTGGVFTQTQDASKTGFTFNLAPPQGSQQNSQTAGQSSIFGQNLTNGSTNNSAGLFQNATSQSGGGLNFNFSKAGSNGNDTKFNFSAGIQSSQPQSAPNMFVGGLNSNAQSQGAFNFSAAPVGGMQSHGLFGGNVATSTGFNFTNGHASTATQGVFGTNNQRQLQASTATQGVFGTNSQQQQLQASTATQGVFGTNSQQQQLQASTATQGVFGTNSQQQQQQMSASTFNFTGLQNQQNSQSTGMLNFAAGQNQTNGGMNPVQKQTQMGDFPFPSTGGFNFSMPHANMALGQGSNLFNFTAGSNTPQKPTNGMFDTGSSNPLGGGFTTPQQQQPGGFNFASSQPLTPVNGFQTAPFSFNAGAAGSPSVGQGGRQMARARRRVKK